MILRPAGARWARPRPAFPASRAAALAVAASALVAWLGPAPTRADPVAWESDWSFTVRSGNWGKVGEKLTAAAAEELVTAPKQLFAAALSGATYLPRGLDRGNSAQLTIPQWFADVGARMKDTATPCATVSRALAAVNGFVCRCAGAIGSGAGLDEVRAVAEHTRAFYQQSATPDGGTALADALGWMRAALLVDGVEAAPVLAAQQELFDQLTAKASGPALATAKAELELGKAMAASDAATARSAIERCIATLKPVVAGTPPPPGPATLTNEALDLSSRRKLGARGDYVMEEKRTSDAKLRLGLPLGLGWSTYAGSEASTLSVQRLGPNGVALYLIEIHMYDVQKSYKSPVSGDAVVGSDLKGVALQRLEIDANAVSAASRKREPKQASVGRGFAPGFYTEVTGADANNAPQTRRTWIVKGKLHPFTYCILVNDTSKSETVSEELKAVIESAAEVKPGK